MMLWHQVKAPIQRLSRYLDQVYMLVNVVAMMQDQRWILVVDLPSCLSVKAMLG